MTGVAAPSRFTPYDDSDASVKWPILELRRKVGGFLGLHRPQKRESDADRRYALARAIGWRDAVADEPQQPRLGME